MRSLLLTIIAALMLALPLSARAQTPADLPSVMAEYGDQIADPKRQTIAPVIAALVATGDPATARLLTAWEARTLGRRKADGAFFLLAEAADGWTLTDPLTSIAAGTAPKSDITQLRPNSGVRGVIAVALVQFQLSDPDPMTRAAALSSMARDADPAQLDPLRAALADPDPALAAQKTRLERLLTMRFDPDSAARVAAIDGFGADLDCPALVLHPDAADCAGVVS